MLTPIRATAQRYLFAACLAAVLCLLPLTASAQTPPPAPEKTISIDVANADLHAVVSTLERQFHIKARVQDGKTPFNPIYLHVESASLTGALRFIAACAGADLTQDADGVYVFTREYGFGLPSAPALPAAGPFQVEIQAAFVSDSLTDLDNRGIQFTAIPVVAPDGSDWTLQVADGQAVAQLYQNLSQGHGMIPATRIRLGDRVTASVSVRTQIPLPPSNHFSLLEASLTFIPRIHSDGSVTLDIQRPKIFNLDPVPNLLTGSSTLSRTVRSGDMIVICSPLLEPGKSGGPFYSDGSPGRAKPFADHAILIFLTPTIINTSIDMTPGIDITPGSGQSVTVTP